MMRPHHWTLSGVVLALFGMDHSPSLSLSGKCGCKRCRFQKLRTTMRLHMRVDYYGEEMLLTSMSYSQGRLLAEYQNAEQYVAEHTLMRKHERGCLKGWHTEAEGCGP